MAKAAAAKKALQDMQAASKAASDEEVRGETAATAARKADSDAIKQEIADLAALKAAAAQANVQTAFGGRSSMDQHLQDMNTELNYKTLLNRAEWLNFSSPQQAYSFMQQQLTLKKQMNYAEWAGYTTPDQYLSFLVRQRTEITAGNTVLLARAQAYRDLAQAALAYDNALQGTHKSLGQLGDSSLNTLGAQLGAIPGEIKTKLTVDDAEALATIAADRAALAGIPDVVGTSVVTAGAGGGSSSQAWARQLAQLMAVRAGSGATEDNQGGLSRQLAAAWAAAVKGRWEQQANWNPQQLLGMGGAGSGGGSPPPIAPPMGSDDWDDWEKKLEGFTAQLEKEFQALEAGPGGSGQAKAAWDTLNDDAESAASSIGDARDSAEEFADVLQGHVLEGADDFIDRLREMADRLQQFGQADVDVVNVLQNAQAHLQGMNVTSADQASRLAYALQQLGKIDPDVLSGFNEQAKTTILDMVSLVARTGDAAQASKAAFGAFQLYSTGVNAAAEASDRLATRGLLELSQGFYKASTAADEASHVIAEAGSSFLGISSRFELWGGKFGENHFAGAIAGWHLWLDAIVEFSAVGIPALAAGVIGLGAFGIAVLTAGNTTTAMVSHLEAMYTVSKAAGVALGPFNRSLDATKSSLVTVKSAADPLAGSMDMLQTQTQAAHDRLGPFATSMDSMAAKSRAAATSVSSVSHSAMTLQQSIQPKAWELLGDVMLVLNHNTGTFGEIANRVGSDLDTLAAKMTNSIVNGSGKGLINFFNLGAADIHRFATLLGSVGSVFGSLVKAAQETQVAERLLTVLGDVAGVVATVFAAIPTPVLAGAIAIHSFLVYGGLFTTWVQRAALGVAGFVARVPGMSGAMLSFGQAIGGSTAQLENMAVKSAALNQIADQLGVTSLEAAKMQAYIASTGQTMEEFASQTNNGRQLIAEYGAGLDETGRKAVVTGVALGGTAEQIAKIADSQNTTPIAGVARAFGISAQGAEQLAEQATSAGFSIEGLAKATDGGAEKLETYGKGLSSAGQDAVGLGIILGGTEEQLSGIAGQAAESDAEVGLFGKAMSGVGGFLASNWLTIAAAAAVGFGVLADKALTASSGVSSFLSNLKSGLQSASGGQLLVTLPQTLGEIQKQITATNAAWKTAGASLSTPPTSGGALWSQWRYELDSAAADIRGIFGGSSTANPDQSALQGQLESELKTYGALTTSIDTLTKQGYNFTESLGVLSAAGVSVGDSLGVMETKIQGLLQGYALAGQQTGAIGSDMDALTISTSSTVTQMGKLNQAYDTFTQTVAGPVGAFITLDQSVQQFATDSKTAGASLSGLSKVTADTTGSLGANALTLQSDFQTVFSNVESLFDAVRTSEATYAGAGGAGSMFTKTVKDSVAALIPLAGTNKAAAAEISALAQEAGGPATTSLAALAKWAGNVHDPMAALQGITNQTATATANLSQDASALTTSIQQELLPQMASSIIAASKAGPAMQGFATAVFSGKTSADQLAPSARTLYDTLLKVSGNASNAGAMFIGFAEAMGLSKKQAEELLGVVDKPIKPVVDTSQALPHLTQMYKAAQQASTPPAPTGWAGFWQQVGMDFTSWVWHPLDTFFNHTLESWYNNSNSALSLSWQQAKAAFTNYFSEPIDKFFNTDIESWYRVAVNGAHTMWSESANYFTADVANPVDRFFTSDITGFFHAGYENFLKDFGDPVANWFSQSLPAGLRAGLNWGIDNVINKFINVVNHDLLGWIPGGIHIPTFQNVASGGLIGGSGSVPGTGDEDGTHAVMMGGEWVLRKPARMALQSKFGPDFLPYLNNADSWLGAGSRGNAASQQGGGRGRYASGGIIGGIEGDISSLVSGGADWLAGFAGWSADELEHIPGISGLVGLAKNGMASLVGGAWDELAGPLVNGVANPFVHDMAGATSTAMKDDIQKLMGVKQAAASASVASTAGLGSGTVRQEELYALSLFPKYGWPSSQLSPLISVWNRESGWNPDAVNPTSGAYGIPQALGKGHPYSLGDWRSQIQWGEQYIAGRYGNPSGAWAHEVADNWYAGGGPVVSAILDRTGNARVREAMALGSWLESRWSTSSGSAKTTEYGPYHINLREHTGATKTNAENAVWSTNWAYPYYSDEVNRVSSALWAKDPMSAAEQAYALAQGRIGTAGTPSAGLLKEGWADVRGALGIGAPATATSPLAGSTNVQKFDAYSSAASAQWNTAFAQWSQLYTRAQPKGTSTKEWEGWVADRLAIASAVSKLSPAWVNVRNNFSNPTAITNAEWQTLRSDLDLWHGLTSGNMPAKSLWGPAEAGHAWPKGYKAGDVTPTPSFGKKYYGAVMGNTAGDIAKLQSDVTNAYNAWHAQWGENLTTGPATPGITVRNPGNPGSQSVNLTSLETGGPTGGGNVGPGGFGFAGGGPVDIAAMFAAGGAVPMPSFVMPGVSASFQKQLSGAAASQLPRTMGDAAGENVGMKVGSMTINNPVAETPSTSIARAGNRLAFLAGRGPV